MRILNFLHFFELLQVAIGNRQCLTSLLTDAEWGDLFETCKQQALLGIGFVGVQRLPVEQRPSADLMLLWVGYANKIVNRNKQLNDQCERLCKVYAHDGFCSCVLKGQSNILGYGLGILDNGMGKDAMPLGMYRTPGDIDLWVKPMERVPIAVKCGDDVEYEYYEGKVGTIEYVMMQHRMAGNKEKPMVRYHHIEAPDFENTAVEIHFRPSYLESPWRNHRLQKWFEENEQWNLCDAKIGDCVFPVPTTSFNVIYQMVHIFRHLFVEGIGLRQLLDYYMVLRIWHNELGEREDRPSMAMWEEGLGRGILSKEEAMHLFGRFGMGKFVTAVMWVLQEVFAMPDAYLLCAPNEQEGRLVLNEILMGGNFGQYDPHCGRTKFQRAINRLRRDVRLFSHYPEVCFIEPFFRVYHWVWRRFELWRY